MTREEKDLLINELAEDLRNHQFVYVTDSSSMNAAESNSLRRIMFQNGVKMRVLKNSLIVKALEKSETNWGELTDTLKGTTALLFASNPKAPAKAIKSFRKAGSKPVLKGAFIDSSVFIGDDKLDVLIDLKSREDLIGDIIGLLQSPAKNVISALQSGGITIAGILKTLSEKEN